MRRVSLYLLILILMPSICFGLNIDTNSNDYVDVPYGGSDAGTFTDGGILIGAGTAAFEATAVGAAGEILVGVAAANPKWLTAGTATYWLVAAGAADPVWTDPAGLTAGIATLATTVTLTDNEATNETNPIWFSAGAAGSGSVGPEADGDLYYNPSTGYLTAPNFAGTTYGSDGSVSDAELLTIDDGATTEILVGGGAGSAPVWGSDIPTAVTIGTAYIYRAGGTDVPDADVADDITLTNITQATSRKINDIQDTDASKAFAWGAYTLTHASTTDGWGGVILHSNVADNASDTTLLTLQSDDADDANTIFLNVIEDADGTPASLFKISQRTLTIGANAGVEGIMEYRIEGGADVMADDKYNGITLGGKVAGSGVSAWNPVFLAADGKYDEADADNALYPAIGLAVLCSDATWDCDADDGLTILIQGVVRNEGWTGLTIGGNVYLSDDPTTTTGITQTAPATSTDCVQKIGVALSDSEIFFNFTGEYYLVE